MSNFNKGLGGAFLATILVAAAGPNAADAATQCSLVEYASMDLTTTFTGEVEVPVMLDGRPYTMLVDTGSDHTAITGETADDLGLERSYTWQGGAFLNNVQIDQFTQLSELRIGRKHSDQRWPVLVIPDDMVSRTTAGLLAPDFLSDGDVEFDFYGGKLNLFVHNTCGRAPVYWTREAYAALPIEFDRAKHIVVQAWLDGKEVKAIFDTGAPSSIMSLDAARELFGWSDGDAKLKREGDERINGGDPSPLYSYPFQSLSFDGVAVRNPQISLIPKANFNNQRNSEATIIVGMSILRQLHLYVDYPVGTVYLTAAEAK